MSLQVIELYDALKSVGVPEDLARSAAKSVIGIERQADLATKADLAELKAATKVDLAELKADLIKWNVGTMLAVAAVVLAIVRLIP